jgi:hypothetical protein
MSGGTATQLKVATQALKEWKELESLYGEESRVEFKELHAQLDACWERQGFTRTTEKGEQ